MISLLRRVIENYEGTNRVKNILINKRMVLDVGGYSFYYFFLDEDTFWKFIDTLSLGPINTLNDSFDKPSKYVVLYAVENRSGSGEVIPKSTALNEFLSYFPEVRYLVFYDLRYRTVKVYIIDEGRLKLLLKRKVVR